jgi:hypothetical protein
MIEIAQEEAALLAAVAVAEEELNLAAKVKELFEKAKAKGWNVPEHQCSLCKSGCFQPLFLGVALAQNPSEESFMGREIYVYTNWNYSTGKVERTRAVGPLASGYTSVEFPELV